MSPTRILIPALVGMCLVSGLAISQHEHARKGPAPPPTSIQIPDRGLTLPMKDIGGRPVVEVTVAGIGPFSFILDTGAHVSVVDSALQAELSLPAAPFVRSTPSHGGAAPEIVQVPELTFGAARLEGVLAVVLRMESLFSGPDAPRGVLSASSFPGYLLTFDYPGKRLILKKGELGRPDDRAVFEYPDDDLLPTIPVRVGGQTARVHLDSGSGGGLTLPERYLELLPLGSEPKLVGRARTHGGEYPLRTAKVRGTLSIGRFPLDSTEVSFSDVGPGSAEPIGNIGYEALRGFEVTLDAKNRRIRLSKPARRS